VSAFTAACCGCFPSPFTMRRYNLCVRGGKMNADFLEERASALIS